MSEQTKNSASVQAAPSPLLEVCGLKTYFPIKKGLLGRAAGYVKAVDDVSFTVGRCETLGVVGESGCGKSTMGRSVLRLIEPTDGKVMFDGTDVRALSPADLRSFRKRMQIIFQDPLSSLDPRYTIDRTLAEPLKLHTNLSDAEIDAYVASKEPADKAGSYGIQGLGRLFVDGIDGDYFNVVGLPVARVAREIATLTGHDGLGYLLTGN